jgi:hypothetical protein
MLVAAAWAASAAAGLLGPKRLYGEFDAMTVAADPGDEEVAVADTAAKEDPDVPGIDMPFELCIVVFAIILPVESADVPSNPEGLDAILGLPRVLMDRMRIPVRSIPGISLFMASASKSDARRLNFSWLIAASLEAAGRLDIKKGITRIFSFLNSLSQ